MAAETLAKSMQSTSLGNGKPSIGSPTAIAARSAMAVLAMFGISPLTRANVQILQDQDMQIAASGATDADILAALQTGDLAYLIAAASGAPLPQLADASAAPHPAGYPDPHPDPQALPRDFTGGQPDGRVGSGPHPVDGGRFGHPVDGQVVEGRYRELSPEEWDEQQRRGSDLEFAFGEQPSDD